MELTNIVASVKPFTKIFDFKSKQDSFLAIRFRFVMSSVIFHICQSQASIIFVKPQPIYLYNQALYSAQLIGNLEKMLKFNCRFSDGHFLSICV